MPALKPHKFTRGNITYLIKLPDVYDKGSEYDIGSAMGISALGDDYEVSADDVTLEISQGMKAGILMRMRVTYQDTTNNGKTKSAKVVCPVEKAATAITTLLSKKYDSGNVTGAGVPRRRRLG